METAYRETQHQPNWRRQEQIQNLKTIIHLLQNKQPLPPNGLIEEDPDHIREAIKVINALIQWLQTLSGDNTCSD
jgi:hypothetical protein